MSNSEAERYALDRLANLTRELAACLTPQTLAAVVVEIAASHNRPIGADLKQFANRLDKQWQVLYDEVPA